MLKCLNEQQDLHNELSSYADGWRKYYGSDNFANWKKSLPQDMRSELPEDFLKTAFEGKEYGKIGDSVSKTGQRLLDSDLSDEVKEKIKARGIRYFKRPDQYTDAAAEFALAQEGTLDDKIALLQTSNEIDPDVKVLLANKLMKIVDAQIRRGVDKEANAERAYELVNIGIMQGRSAGRTLRMFRTLGWLSPEGVLSWSNRMTTKIHERVQEKHRDAIKEALEDVKAAGARARADLPSVFGLTRDQIRSKKAEALKKFKKASFGQASSGNLLGSAKAMAHLAEVAFYEILDGAITLKEFRTRMSKHFPDVPFTDIEDQVLSLEVGGKKVSEWMDGTAQEELKELIGTPELIGKLKELGIDEATAKALNKSYNDKVKKQIKKLRSNALTSLGEGGQVTKAMYSLLDKGEALTQENIEKELIDVSGYREMTAAEKATIMDMAREMEAMPEGLLRDQQAAKIAKFQHEATGKRANLEVAMSLWYAAVLSGPATHAVNIGSNMINVAAELTVSTIRNLSHGDPKAALKAWAGLGRGLVQGYTEGKSILFRGEPVNKDSSKFFEAAPLEKYGVSKAVRAIRQAKTPQELFEATFKFLPRAYAGAMRYFPRALAAADSFFYYGLLEARTAELARQYAVKFTNDKAERQRYYRDVMGYDDTTPEYWKAVEEDLKAQGVENIKQEIEDRKKLGPYAQAYFRALDQARLEQKAYKEATGKEFEKDDLKRRALEILDDKRSNTAPLVTERAATFASKGTFNYRPEGVLGVWSRVMAQAGNEFPPNKFIVPFTGVVANVLNQQIDYIPIIGAARAAPGGLTRWLSPESVPTTYPKYAEERERQIIKSMIVGAAPMLYLIMRELSNCEDEDCQPTITGRGPDPSTEKGRALGKILQESGWKPYSIRVGDTWISYQYTPMALLMTIMGNYFDKINYDGLKPEEEKLQTMVKQSISQVPGAVLDMSFLKGLSEFFTSVGDDRRTASYLERFAARVPTSFAPNVLNSIDKAFDDDLYDTDGYKERVVNGLPFIRHELGLKPQRNLFGDRIERYIPGWGKIGNFNWSNLVGLDRFVSQTTFTSKATELVVTKKLAITPIGGSTTMGGVYAEEGKDGLKKVALKDMPDLLYDYQMVVGKLVKRAVEDQYDDIKALTHDEAQDLFDKLFGSIKKDVKKAYEGGATTEEIMQSYELEVD